MNDVVGDALEAVEQRDWMRLKPLLHPYLHWTNASGTTFRGRTKVLESLAGSPPPAEPPAAHEMRDGQIYRWAAGRESDPEQRVR